jgi:ABC-type transport system involved in cytochrome c biogenesis permease subunit
MPKWFVPTAIICGAMFAASPFVIASADYESTMGLVQKIFYYHMPSAWIFLVAAIVCGIASIRFLITGDPRHDRTALAAGELVVLFGLITLVTGPLWARRAWGCGWRRHDPGWENGAGGKIAYVDDATEGNDQICLAIHSMGTQGGQP